MANCCIAGRMSSLRLFRGYKNLNLVALSTMNREYLLFSEVVLLKTNNHIKTYSNLRKIENFNQIANGQKLKKSTNNTIKSTLTT